MHARWRVIAPWICVVGVLGALWLAKLSPSYKQCDAHEKQYAATEKARNSQEERARRFVICEGAFVDANREAITAAATVAIAAFTRAPHPDGSDSRVWRVPWPAVPAQTAAQAA